MKQLYNEKMEKKICDSSRIYNTRCHNDNYLLLFGKGKLESFDIYK